MESLQGKDFQQHFQRLLFIRYSRIILPKEELYIASTAVVMSECFKFVISIIGFSIEQQTAGKSLDLFNHVFGPNSGIKVKDLRS